MRRQSVQHWHTLLIRIRIRLGTALCVGFCLAVRRLANCMCFRRRRRRIRRLVVAQLLLAIVIGIVVVAMTKLVLEQADIARLCNLGDHLQLLTHTDLRLAVRQNASGLRREELSKQSGVAIIDNEVLVATNRTGMIGDESAEFDARTARSTLGNLALEVASIVKPDGIVGVSFLVRATLHVARRYFPRDFATAIHWIVGDRIRIVGWRGRIGLIDGFRFVHVWSRIGRRVEKRSEGDEEIAWACGVEETRMRRAGKWSGDCVGNVAA